MTKNESSTTTDSTEACERIDVDNQRKIWVAVRSVAAIDDEYFIARNSVPHENAESVESAARAKLEAGKPLRKSLGLGLESIKLAKIGTVSLIRPLGIISVSAGIEGTAARLGTGAPEAFAELKQRLAPDADVETGKSTIQDVPLSPRGLLIALVGIAVSLGLAYGAAVGPEAVANFSPIRQLRWLRAVVAAGVSIGSGGFAVFAGIGFVALAAYLIRWQKSLPEKEFFRVES